jgi:hypothetical protein
VTRLPEYLAAIGYSNPGSDAETSTPFQYSNNTPLSFYQALGANPVVRSGFDERMQNFVLMERKKYKTGFASIFDFEGIVGPLIKSDNDVAVVDVGGSRGHVLEDVVKYLPGLKGRLVLEDLPEAIASAELNNRIESVPYNFLENEQPIKGHFPILLTPSLS